MKNSIAGNRVSRIDTTRSIEGSEASARFRKDDPHGSHVPDVHDGIEHGLGATARDQEMPVAIPPAPRNPGFRTQIGPGFPPWRARRRDGRAIAQKGIGNRRDRRDATGRTVQERSMAFGRPHALAQSRHVDDPHHGLPLIEKRKQGPEERNAVDECLGPVDGIDDPLEAGLRMRDSMLLPDHAMLGTKFGETPPHKELRLAIGLGDRRAVAFLHDLDLLLVAREDGLLRFLHETECESEFGFEIVRGHRVPKVAEQVRKPDWRYLSPPLPAFSKTKAPSARPMTTQQSPIQPNLAFDGSLPIHARVDDLVDALVRHPVVILAGETGSGKTTQIPRILLKAGCGKSRPVVVTQPRRVAAMSLGRRVAEEMKVEGTGFVGHKVRFDNRTTAATRVVFATDGALLAELGSDPDLRRYDAIVVDEAHERSLNVDFLLGVLQRIRRRRPDLRIVIASATIDTEAFAKAFADARGVPAPVVQVEGRSYPVDILYRDELVDEDDDETLPERTAAAIREMLELGEGDLLAFLPGEREIRETQRQLEKTPTRNTEIVPLFGRLSAADQDRVFHPGPKRRVILSTNVAETSVTVPRIRLVVDTGLARIARYAPRTRTKRLQIEAVSQASARQRAGRCGRVAPGICLRLYSREDFEQREAQTLPEVRRADLSEVILRLLDLGLGAPEDFPFLDPPERRQISDGWQLLRELGAVDDEGALLKTGRRMARLPLDPRSARILVEASREHCLREAVVLASGLSIPDPRERPEGKEDAAKQAQKPFEDRQSDFLSLLNLYEACEKELGAEGSGNRLRKFCQKHFLSYPRMRDWREATRQVSRLLAEDPELDPGQQKGSADYGQIHRALLAGFLSNVARLDEEAFARTRKGDKDAQRRAGVPYRVARGRTAVPWPGSVLARASCTWLVAAEVVETSRTWARTCAEVDPASIEAVAGDLVKREYGPARWDEAGQQAVCEMRILLWGLPLVSGRRCRAIEADPDQATLCFAREALVEARLQGRFPFLEANLALRERIRGLEDRTRRRALWVGEDAEAEWYRARLPKGLGSRSDLQGHIKANGDAALRMTESDLISDPSLLPRGDAFPDRWKAGGLDLALSYRFSPGDDDDGVVLLVPETQLGQIPDAALEWSVPGLLPERIETLLRALPRDLRAPLIPLGDSSRKAAIFVDPLAGRKPLREALAEWVRSRGIPLKAALFPQESDLPPHLRFLVRVLGPKGEALGEGRELPELRTRFAERMRRLQLEASKSALGTALRRDLRDWPRDLDLPAQEEIRVSGALPIVLFPALAEGDQNVEVRRFPTQEEARLSHHAAVSKLLSWTVDGSDHLLAWLPRDVKLPQDILLPLSAFTDARLFHQGLCESLRSHALESGRNPSISTRERPGPRDVASFSLALDEARRRIRSGRGEAVAIVRALVAARTAFEDEARRIPSHRPDLARLAELTRERLWPAGFPANTPWETLSRIPAWWKAAARRIASAKDNPARDLQRVQEFAPLAKMLATRTGSTAPPARWPGKLGDPDPLEQLSELAFLLEEFRIQIWAQETGTAIPASRKRVEEAFAAAGF